MFHGGVGVQFVQEGLLVDVVEAGFQIGIEHKFSFEPNTVENRIESIVG